MDLLLLFGRKDNWVFKIGDEKRLEICLIDMGRALIYKYLLPSADSSPVDPNISYFSQIKKFIKYGADDLRYVQFVGDIAASSYACIEMKSNTEWSIEVVYLISNKNLLSFITI